MDRYTELQGRIEAGELLTQMGGRRLDAAAAARTLDKDHPEIAARIRSEVNWSYLQTLDGLFAEAILQEAVTLDPIKAVRQLGSISDDPVGNGLVTDALKDSGFRIHVVTGLYDAFQEEPFFVGDKDPTVKSSTVEEVRTSLVQARSTWADPSARDLREL